MALPTTLAEVKSPDEAQQSDPIAEIVLTSFRRAQLWRRTLTLGSTSVEQVLHNCYDQYHNEITPRDAALMKESGIDLKISITRYKVDILVAWFRDLFQSSGEAPFVVSPTPIPELSDEAMREVKALMVRGFTGQYPSDAPPAPDVGAPPEEVFEWARALKRRQLKIEQDVAQSRSDGMQRLIEDQLVEGDFRNELMDFMTNFAVYPYAVMYGPVVERRPFLAWDGDKARDKFEKVLVCRNISPFDYFWSPDTKEGGKGTYDIIRERVSRRYLMECVTLPGFIRANVLAALGEYGSLTTGNWMMSQNPDDADEQAPSLNPHDDSVTVLRYFGALSGRVLKQFGITNVADTDYVEVEALVLGQWTLRVVVSRQPKACGRPVYVSSYNKTPGMLPGYGIAQTIREPERAFMAAIRNGLTNAAFAAAPMGEVEFQRVQRFLPPGDIGGSAMPGVVVPVDADAYGGGRPAHTFHNIPNNTNLYMSMASWYLDFIDRLSGLPAALSGQPVGTGVNRTFRGVAQLYANALKGVQSALTNMDKDLFQPLGTSYFVHNMKYSEDQEIKGDAKVMARGTSGLLEKELAKQGSLELLQTMGPLLQTGEVPAPVLSWAVREALIAAGVPKEKFDDAEAARQAQQEQAASAAQAAILPTEAGQPAATAALPPGGAIPPTAAAGGVNV